MKKAITYLCLMAIIPTLSYSNGIAGKALKLTVEQFDFSELEERFARTKNGYFSNNYIYKTKMSPIKLEILNMILTLKHDHISDKEKRSIELSLLPLILNGKAMIHNPSFAQTFLDILEGHEVQEDTGFTKDEISTTVESLEDFILQEDVLAASREEINRELGFDF